MNLVENLKEFIEQGEYTHILRLSSGVIILFRPVERGTNPNKEYKESEWQVNSAWPNTLAKSKWSVLSPMWIHPADTYTSQLREMAIPVQDFLRENLTIN